MEEDQFFQEAKTITKPVHFLFYYYSQSFDLDFCHLITIEDFNK